MLPSPHSATLRKGTSRTEELNYGEIRVTPDERYSVFDVIEVIGGKKNPWDAWISLSSQFTEVLGKVEDFKFPGRGQRQTPVTNKEGLLYILGLLPGAVGRTYREGAAKLMLAKIEGRSDEFVQKSDKLAKKYIQQTGKTLSKNNTDRGNAVALNKLLIELGFQNKNDNDNPAYLPT